MKRIAAKTPQVNQLPERWQQSLQAVRAVQVAFDVSEAVLEAVRVAAFEASLSTSDQLRAILGLPIIRKAQRPRLTISLSAEDYVMLSKRYGLPGDDHLAIKECVIVDLTQFAGSRQVPNKTGAAQSSKNTTTIKPNAKRGSR